MKKWNTHLIILFSLLFFFGYFCGVWLHPYIHERLMRDEKVDLTRCFGDNVVDLSTGKFFSIDTLSTHEKNLLIFWSPSCSFSRQFFQNRLNSEVIGVFCFPLSDDWEYVEYFMKYNEICYPQLVRKNGNDLLPVDAPFVKAIPRFLVVDSNGQVLVDHVGIDGIDDLITSLY